MLLATNEATIGTRSVFMRAPSVRGPNVQLRLGSLESVGAGTTECAP